jgi:uridine kinase
MEEKTKQGRLFIGVTGGTASGKTSLTKRIDERFAESSITVVSLDSFYRGLS